jgi:hypothetical protein
MEGCELRSRVKNMDFPCDENQCVFWFTLGLSGTPQCAVKYFQLLDGSGREFAEWLLSLKEHQIRQLIERSDPAP